MTAQLRALLANAPGVIGAARVLRLDQLVAPAAAPHARWGLEPMRGRLVELSAHGAAATLTAAADLVLEAQRAAEPVAWIELAGSGFFPPDLAASGVDLAALVVVRVGEPSAATRAAARLLASGAFGLVILDFAGAAALDVPMAQQGRLVTLAQNHDAAVVCLTDKPADVPSLSSLVSLRAEATRADHGDGDGDAAQGNAARGDAVRIEIRKDKQRGAGGVHVLALGVES
ncbi:MAG TPA: recombinase A [Kofleriaceae bacterium]|nr:recombinase A [Kofleriaceae bacterium]